MNSSPVGSPRDSLSSTSSASGNSSNTPTTPSSVNSTKSSSRGALTGSADLVSRTSSAGQGAIRELSGVLTLFGTEIGYNFEAVPASHDMLLHRAEARTALKAQLEGLIGALVSKALTEPTPSALQPIANALTRLGLGTTEFSAGFTAPNRDVQKKILTFIKCLTISSNGTIHFDDSPIEELARTEARLVLSTRTIPPHGTADHESIVQSGDLQLDRAQITNLREGVQQALGAAASRSQEIKQLQESWTRSGAPVAPLLASLNPTPSAAATAWPSAALVVQTLFAKVFSGTPPVSPAPHPLPTTSGTPHRTSVVNPTQSHTPAGSAVLPSQRHTPFASNYGSGLPPSPSHSLSPSGSFSSSPVSSNSLSVTGSIAGEPDWDVQSVVSESSDTVPPENEENDDYLIPTQFRPQTTVSSNNQISRASASREPVGHRPPPAQQGLLGHHSA